MKILLVTDQFFHANNGMTISSRRFAEVLKQHGHEIRIVSTASPEETMYAMKKQYIPIFDNLVTSQGMTFARPDDTLLTEAIRWADIVHFLSPFTLTHHGIRIARKLHVPYTAAFHVQPENITSSIHLGKVSWVNSMLYRWFRFYIYRYCTHIHCPSRFIAGELQRFHYPGKLHVISNGIDPDFVYRKLPKTEEFSGYFVILMIGRYSIEKRQDVLIRAVSQSRHRDHIRLVLAGQGPRAAALRSLADSLQIPVHFEFFNKQGLLDMIAMSDLYVHAADMEIEAMSCMEAFAGGLVPIIADSTKSATPQFALDERSLFPAGDSTALAEKIDYWIEHEAERLEMEHRYSEAAGRYRLDDCVRQAEDMFEAAIKENTLQKGD